MLELIISYFLTKFNIITKKPNNPDCHLNHSVSMEEPNGLDATYSDTTLNYTVCSAMKCFTITLSFPLRLIISTAAFAISDTE